MKASPPIPLLVLLAGILLGGPADAEYPFDRMFDPAYHGPVDAPGFDGRLPLVDGYGHGPLPYEDGYPPFDDVFSQDLAIWPGWVSAAYQPGSDRSIGSGEWFQPLYQDGRRLWYFDFRGQGDSDSASEFNLGTGVRILNEPGWIFGAYAFWDHLNSPHGNNFNQGMIGIEAMDVFWDARFNVYFPESGGQRVGVPRARVSGGNIVVQTGLERAYWGFDLEGGNLLWAWGGNTEFELRGFYGIYHFDHSANATQSITGPRGRLEWRWYDLFGPGSRLTCGLTVQGDRVRNGQVFGFIRLRLPLDPWMQNRKPLSPLHRRMLDHVVRDVDIVSATSRMTESALNPHTGREINGFRRIDANTQNVGDVLDGLDDGSVIVLDGSAGDVLLPKSIGLKPGQLVLGGGSSISVRGEQTGVTTTFTAGGSRPTVQFDQYANVSWKAAEAGNNVVEFVQKPPIDGFVMNDHTQLLGVDVTHSQSAAVIKHTSNVLIHDVEVTDFYGPAVGVIHSDDVTLDDVRIRDAKEHDPYMPQNWTVMQGDMIAPAHPDTNPLGVGILVADSTDVLIDNSSIRNVWADGIRVIHSHDVAVLRTEIKNIDRDAIRLIRTENVLLADLEIKNTGKSKFFEYHDWMEGDVSRLIGGITLKNTLNTHIHDSFIHNSKGVGIFGEQAESTLMQRLDIADVEHGIKFIDSHDLGVFDTTIQLPNEEHRPPEPGHFQCAAIGCGVPLHLGIWLDEVTGDAAVRDSTITGGFAGAAIDFIATSGSTNLWITGNTVQRDAGYALAVASAEDHQLTAHIERNEFLALDVFDANNTFDNRGSVLLLYDSDQPSHIEFSHNTIEDRFIAAIAGSTMDLDVTDNHLGGDPMGSINVTPGGALHLEYRRNTSTPGAEVIRFRNQGGTFQAVGGGNDHVPDLQGNIDVTVEENAAGPGTINSGAGSK